jgi:hypothetical protein
VNVVEFAAQFKRAANTSKTHEWEIPAKKNKNHAIAYKTFQINKMYFILTWSFILQIGIVKNNFTAANNAHISVTHQALPTTSFTYIEKYVSVHNHHQSINNVNDNDIVLIFTGTNSPTLDNVFLILFNIYVFILKLFGEYIIIAITKKANFKRVFL